MTMFLVELWVKFKKIDDDWLEYSKGYKKIKFNSDDNLPLNKIFIVMIKIIVVIIVIKKKAKIKVKQLSMQIKM